MQARSTLFSIGSTLLTLALAACGDDGSNVFTGAGGSGSGGAGPSGTETTGTETTGSETTGTETTGSQSTGSETTTSSASGGGEGGSGPSSTSSGDGGAQATSTSSGEGGAGPSTGTSTGTGTASTTSSVVSSSSGGACLADTLFSDPVCDDCAHDQCCSQLEDCLADTASCFNDEGTGIDPDSVVGGALLTCLQGSCADECGAPGGICDSGVSTGDPAIDECLGESCCADFNACTANGGDVDACVACFNAGGGPLCDAAFACSDASGCFGGGTCAADEFECGSGECIFDFWECDGFVDCQDGSDEANCSNCAPDEYTCGSGECIPDVWECDDIVDCQDGSDEANCGTLGICDSGVTAGDPDADACLTDNCCAQFMFCTSNGTNVDACIDCYQAGGGALCDPAIACNQTFGCF